MHVFKIDAFQHRRYAAQLPAVLGRFTNGVTSMDMSFRVLSRTLPYDIRPLRDVHQDGARMFEDTRDVLRALTSAAAPDLSRTMQQRRDGVIRVIAHDPLLIQLYDEVQAGIASLDARSLLNDSLQHVMWAWRWHRNYRRALDTVAEKAPPMALDHYLLCWPDRDIAPTTQASALREMFMLPRVTPLPHLPPFIQGRYREVNGILEPETPGEPFVSIMTAYDVRGEWGLGCLGPLLMRDLQVVWCMDVRTLDRAKARKSAEDAETILRNATTSGGVRDQRTLDALSSVQYAKAHLGAQSLHEVAYAVMIYGQTRRDVLEHVSTVESVFAGQLMFERERGMQEDYLKLFGPFGQKELRAPLVRRNTLAQGVAAKLPFSLRKTTRTEGMQWGYDVHEGIPIYYNLWGDHGYENGHLMMIGQSGSGKTVSFLTLGLRAAVDGTQVIFFDPLGKCGWLTEAVGSAAAYYEIDTHAPVNIMDIVHTNMREQRDVVVRRLQILLGNAIIRGEDVSFDPREFTNFELGAIDRAIEHPHVYGRGGSRIPQIDPANPPLLEDLVRALRDLEQLTTVERTREAGGLLADEIESALLGSAADLFNRPTTLRWDFDGPVVAYNFQKADKRLLPLYYDLGFEALNVWVRSPERKAKYPHLVTMVDEFKFMASVKTLEANVAMATKTWRNHGAAMWTADQNASTYFGQDGLPSEWGPFVSENVKIKMIGRQEGRGAEILARIYENRLSDGDMQDILTGKEGQFVTMLGDDTHKLSIQLTDLETTFFIRAAEQRRNT